MGGSKATGGFWRAVCALGCAALLSTTAAASAHDTGSPPTVGPQPERGASTESGEVQLAAITGCSGAAITPDLATTGAFGTELEGSYVLLPFQVPVGTDAVRVKYCFDQPTLTNDQNRHTLDIGLYQSRPSSSVLWNEDEFRGWGGSSRRDVTVSPEGTIDPDPNPVATSKTTVGFRPGPIPPGEWAVELGVAAIGDELPTEDGAVEWRVEIDLIDDPSFADEPYAPVAYDGDFADPAPPDPGWYAGDLHVHARHSNPGDATMRETFSYAFCPDPALGALCDPDDAKPGAGLDFITLSDYVSDRAWGEIGAFQPDYPGKLIVRSGEVITYQGHANNHASAEYVDYRTGPLYEAAVQGAGTERTIDPINAAAPDRAARPPSEIFDSVHGAGGFTQINHPTIFPSEVPTFGSFCRGCPWDYSDADTDYSKVDAIEVATGPAGLQESPFPGPNPFTPLAIEFYEHGLDTGAKIAAVGSSDSHNAGRRDDPVTQAPIGMATTVVRADELSEQGIKDGVQVGHTYVKLWGNDGPDLRFCAGALGLDSECSLGPDPAEAIMGDTVNATNTEFTARVLEAGAGATRPGVYTLLLVKDGVPVLEVPITSDDFPFSFPSFGLGRYRLQVMRLTTGVASIENVSSPIYLESAGVPPDTDADDDGVDDDVDNCPLTANPGQEDLDGDGLGDACDADRDGDNVANASDACPSQAGPASNGGCPVASRLAADCASVRTGTPKRDRLVGGPDGERLIGLRGPDVLLGRGGDDCLEGRGGGDRLRGGPESDLILGGRGPDRINARDGEADVVNCGRGDDLARIDAVDRVLGGCERVRRS